MGKTLVMGATEDRSRYAYLAANSLLKHGNEVVLFGLKPGNIQGVPIVTELPDHIDDLETITLYMNPRNQEPYLAKMLALKPKRIIFNPGTEGEKFERMCEENGIDAIEGCTLVMLSTNQY